MRSATAVIILTIILVGFVGVATYYVWRAHNVVKLLPGLGLSEELGPQPYLTYATVGQLHPGMVFQTVADKQGWQVKPKDTVLYNVLKLSNMNLAVNDVIAPILYDWWFDGVDDYLYWSFRTGNFSLVDVRAGVDVVNYPSVISENMISTYGFSIGLTTAGSVRFSVYNGTRLDGVATANRIIGYHVIEGYFDDNIIKLIVDGSVVASKSTDLGFSWFSTSDIAIASQVPLGLGLAKGRVSYVEYRFKDLSGNQYHYLFSATFYNGTAYTDIIHGTPLKIHGNPARIPTEHPKLFLLNEAASDNKLHFKWFPSGTIVKIIDSGGNVIRQFTIDGTPVNSDNQIEDYAISLSSTTIPSATVEAYVPALAVRVYGPYGAIVKIVGSDGTVYGSKTIGPDGYVDIPLTHALQNAKVVIAAGKLVKDKLDVRVDESKDGTITVTVYDKGVLVPGMLVRIADPSNTVVYAGVTGQDGKVSFKPSRPLPSITVEVSGIWNGAIQYAKKEVHLSASNEAGTVTPTHVNHIASGNYWWWVLAGLGLILLLAAAVALGRRR